MAQGYLQVDVVSDVNNFPVQDAEITISSVDAPETVIRRLMTNSSGQTENVVLGGTGPKALSFRPGDVRPYSEYQVAVSAPGYEPAVITGTEILSRIRRRSKMSAFIRLRDSDRGGKRADRDSGAYALRRISA